MVRTHVEYDPREGVYKIWCWAPRGGENVILAYSDVLLVEGEAIPFGTGASMHDTKPTLIVDFEIMEALVEAFDPGLNPGNALSTHLTDAITVRDRLLSLVENWSSRNPAWIVHR